MSRTALMRSLALTALVLAPTGVPGDAIAEPRGPIVSARLVECLTGPTPENRSARFRGAMRRVQGSERMWMRFRLQERVGEGRFRRVAAPGLGTWHRSRPGVRRFAFRQRVLALAEGSSYRTVVSFRWYAAGGELVRRTRRRSQPCTQPGLLPNLRVTRVGGGLPLTGLPAAHRYSVGVANRGRATAVRFGVSLAVDGATVDTQAVSALAPGESRRLLFSGPACTGTVTAVADPEDTVREVSERDNKLTLPCPSRR